MMGKSFCIGLMLGAVGGALILANSQKAMQMVKKSQDEIKQKVTDFVDDKIEEKAQTEEKGQTKTKKA